MNFAQNEGLDYTDVKPEELTKADRWILSKVNNLTRDVTALMDYVLDSNSPVCLVCADVDGNGKVDVADVTALVDRVLGVVSLKMKRPYYLLAE